MQVMRSGLSLLSIEFIFNFNKKSMTTIALKQKLHHQIDLIDNVDLLKDLNKIIENTISGGIYKFTDFQKESINISLEQIKNGEFISNEDLEKEMDLWLNSK